MVLVDIAIEIALIGFGLAAVSRFLQIKFGNKKLTNEIQKQIKQKQEKAKELAKKNDEQSKKEAEKINMEMMQDLNKMMSSNMKVMMISMVVFFPALAALAALYNGKIVELPFPTIVFHRGGDFFFWFEFSQKANWFSWYLVWTILGSIVLGPLFKKLKLE